MLMCLPSDGYVINQTHYDVCAKKQEWNHGLRCIGNIEAPNIVAVENKVSGFKTDGTELTLTKLNGLSMNDYVTDGALQFLLNGYVDLGSLDDYATTSSLNTLAGRVTTLETKTTGLSYSGGTTVFNAVPKIGNESLIDFFYPVGKLYQSSDNAFNPNTKWGGTWLKIEGRFILGSNSTKLVGNTGGNEKVTIGLNQIPDHYHMYEDTTHICTDEKLFNSVMDTTRTYATNNYNSVSKSTSAIDREDPQSQLDIMPPYEVVNIWKRTA